MGQKVNANLFRYSRSFNWFLKNNSNSQENESLDNIRLFYIYKFLKKIFLYKNVFLHNCKVYMTSAIIHIYVSYFVLNMLDETSFLHYILKRYKVKNFDNFKFANLKKNGFVRFISNCFYEYNNKKNMSNNITCYMVFQNSQRQLLRRYSRFSVLFFLKKQFDYKFKKYKKKFEIFFYPLLNIFLVAIIKKHSANLLAEFLVFIYSLKIYKKKHTQIFNFINELSKKGVDSKVSLIQGIKIQVSGRFNGKLRASKRFFLHKTLPLSSYSVNINYAEKVAYTIYGTFGIKVWIYEK